MNLFIHPRDIVLHGVLLLFRHPALYNVLTKIHRKFVRYYRFL